MPVKRTKAQKLSPLRPNVGIKIAYQKKIDRLIDEMSASVTWHLKAAYRANPPTLAMDDILPANALKRAIALLKKRWLRKFEKGSVKLAKYFAQAAHKRTDKALASILRKSGFSVRFQMSAAMRDVVAATTAENVALIKSIPQKYLADVEVHVMQSINAGRDLGTLAKHLQKTYGITKRRAALISRDQNSKATSSMQRVRHLELGITKATWRHSAAGKTWRRTHVAMNGKTYDIAKGFWDSDEKAWVQPGQLINCFPGSTRIDFADNVEKAYRRWYSGQLTQIVTDSGKTLRATPNHPILGPDGWVSVGAIEEGQYITEISDGVLTSIVPERNADDAVATLSQIFETLQQTGAIRSEVSLRRDFHGDGTEGNVDVVLAAWLLRFGREAMRAHGSFKFDLAVTYLAKLGVSFVERFGLRCDGPTPSLVGCGSQPPTAISSLLFHSDKGRTAPISDLTTGRDNPRYNRASGDAMNFRESEYARPSFMFQTQHARVIHVDRSSFDGHVYNLQTESGWYIAEGIISHNCKCQSIPIVPGFS